MRKATRRLHERPSAYDAFTEWRLSIRLGRRDKVQLLLSGSRIIYQRRVKAVINGSRSKYRRYSGSKFLLSTSKSNGFKGMSELHPVDNQRLKYLSSFGIGDA